MTRHPREALSQRAPLATCKQEPPSGQAAVAAPSGPPVPPHLRKRSAASTPPSMRSEVTPSGPSTAPSTRSSSPRSCAKMSTRWPPPRSASSRAASSFLTPGSQPMPAMAGEGVDTRLAGCVGSPGGSSMGRACSVGRAGDQTGWMGQGGQQGGRGRRACGWLPRGGCMRLARLHPAAAPAAPPAWARATGWSAAQTAQRPSRRCAWGPAPCPPPAAQGEGTWASSVGQTAAAEAGRTHAACRKGRWHSPG